MNPIRSILVHLDASPYGAARLRTARALAGRLDATVSALYAVTPLFVQLASPLGVGIAADALATLDAERREAARALVARVNAEPGVTVQLHESDYGPEYTLIQSALYADLLVLGQHDRSQRDTGVLPDTAQSVLIASGRPALIVPYVTTGAPRFDTAFIAWKESRESARAVSAAMPLLRLAKAVHVGVDASGADGSALQRYLQRHGIEAKCHTLTTEPGQAGEMLLSMAADVSADLMVMGCYGHSRAREWLLGGASRSVLDAMTVPVLMAH